MAPLIPCVREPSPHAGHQTGDLPSSHGEAAQRAPGGPPTLVWRFLSEVAVLTGQPPGHWWWH